MPFIIGGSGSGGTTGSTGPTDAHIIDLNAGDWLLDKNGNALASKDDMPIVIGDIVPKTLTSERAHVGLVGNNTPDIVHEFAVMQCPFNGWNNSHVSVGGMTFRWSQGAATGGFLRWQRSADCSAPTTKRQGSCLVSKYGNGVPNNFTSSSFNYDLFAKEWVGDDPANPTFDGLGQVIEWFMVDLSINFPRTFRVKAMATNINFLLVLVEYFGPKIVTLRGL